MNLNDIKDPSLRASMERQMASHTVPASAERKIVVPDNEDALELLRNLATNAVAEPNEGGETLKQTMKEPNLLPNQNLWAMHF